ncbi:hypothetical protein EBX31_01820 [bacterium]|nr:hypothetical protein [bacterium]
MKSKEMQSDATSPKRDVRMKDGLDFETIQQIEKLSGLGLTQPQIAYVVSIKPKKFQWYLQKDSLLREAMDRGIARANAQVAMTLFKLATSGECPAATFFWAKTRMGWKESNHLDVSLRPDIVYRSTVKADGSLIQEVIEEGKVLDAEGKP